MTRILITGMSGTGKSTVIGKLAERGHRAVDLDSDAWSAWVPADGNPTGAKPGHDWMWKEDAVARLLSEDGSGRGDPGKVLFVSGCAPNMRKFLARFDHVVLLSAPAEVLLERIASRTNNAYGKRPEEAAQVLANLREIEPKLRRIATCTIDAALPVEEVIEQLLALA